MSKQIEYQIRSDSFSGKYPGTRFFYTFNEAYTAASEDQNVWKISFFSDDHHRFVRKRPGDKWSNLEEKRLSAMRSDYNLETTWWVDQPLKMGHPSKNICEVLTDDEFVNKYTS